MNKHDVSLNNFLYVRKLCLNNKCQYGFIIYLICNAKPLEQQLLCLLLFICQRNRGTSTPTSLNTTFTLSLDKQHISVNYYN